MGMVFQGLDHADGLNIPNSKMNICVPHCYRANCFMFHPTHPHSHTQKIHVEVLIPSMSEYHCIWKLGL